MSEGQAVPRFHWFHRWGKWETKPGVATRMVYGIPVEEKEALVIVRVCVICGWRQVRPSSSVPPLSREDHSG